MEEASYLATTVGIMSKRMLGGYNQIPRSADILTTPAAQLLAHPTNWNLAMPHTRSEVHFPCPSQAEMLRVHTAIARIPGARMVNDVSTCFEALIGMNSQGGVTSVADIFEILSMEKGFPEFTVGKSTFERAFIKIINEDVASNAHHEEFPIAKRFWGMC
jgi:hypothetical protein